MNYRFYFLYISVFLILCGAPVNSQKKAFESVREAREAREYLETRGEAYLSIPVSERKQLLYLSNVISIDRIDSSLIYVYVSPKGFNSLIANRLAFNVETPPSLEDMAIQPEGEFPGDWNRYPTYDEYLAFLLELAETYPEICRIDTIGFSINNRAILALKISDKVNTDEPEPGFFYTSSIHGDETGGYYLLLRLACWLMSAYGVDDHITSLVDQMQIWINPLANPDGTYFMGNDIISGAKRFNINNVDLNRNFPDPEDGPHPDGEEYQPETIAMMRFMESRNFTLSANLHGGAELLNYPWDTWAKFHPDDDWYQFICRQYADTAHKFSSLYMKDMVNGITNGWSWYEINGGRQDWVNYFVHGREITIELFREKIAPADTLPWLWECSRRSLLNYMEQASFGISGTVTDSQTHEALRAEISIQGHDSLNSYIFSDSISGKFYRLIKEGTFDLKITASGYMDTIISSVTVSDYSKTALDIRLTPSKSGVVVPASPGITVSNPFNSELIISFDEGIKNEISIELFDAGGRKINHSYQGRSGNSDNTIVIDCHSVVPGIYILKITSASISYESIIVKKE